MFNTFDTTRIASAWNPFNRQSGGGMGVRLDVNSTGFDTRCHSSVTDDVETQVRPTTEMDQIWTAGRYCPTRSKVPKAKALKVRYLHSRPILGMLGYLIGAAGSHCGLNCGSQYPL